MRPLVFSSLKINPWRATARILVAIHLLMLSILILGVTFTYFMNLGLEIPFGHYIFVALVFTSLFFSLWLASIWIPVNQGIEMEISSSKIRIMEVLIKGEAKIRKTKVIYDVENSDFYSSMALSDVSSKIGKELTLEQKFDHLGKAFKIPLIFEKNAFELHSGPVSHLDNNSIVYSPFVIDSKIAMIPLKVEHRKYGKNVSVHYIIDSEPVTLPD